jgi:cell shape-determining protein MreC
LALLGGGFIAVSNVKIKIDDLSTNLAGTENKLVDSKKQFSEAKDAEEEAKRLMTNAQSEANNAKERLSIAEKNLVAQRQRANGHEANANRLNAELVEARKFSESWRLFQQANGTQEQIRQKLANFAEVNNQRDNFKAENEILLSQIEKTGVELSRYTGTSVKVTLPQNLHGTVTAVDAQFDFVVLDIGESQGAREHGELLVSRGEKLIGKLRILDVKKDHSIANILPDWKQEEIQTGDLVIVGN